MGGFCFSLQFLVCLPAEKAESSRADGCPNPAGAPDTHLAVLATGRDLITQSLLGTHWWTKSGWLC